MNSIALSGSISRSGPTLTYTKNLKPITRFKLGVVDGRSAYVTWIPVAVIGAQAQPLLETLHGGEAIELTGWLSRKPARSKDLIELEVMCYGVHRLTASGAAETSAHGEYADDHERGALLTEAARPAAEPKVRKRPYPKAARAGGFAESN
jgi:hypothetical protein